MTLIFCNPVFFFFFLIEKTLTSVRYIQTEQFGKMVEGEKKIDTSIYGLPYNELIIIEFTLQRIYTTMVPGGGVVYVRIFLPFLRTNFGTKAAFRRKDVPLVVKYGVFFFMVKDTNVKTIYHFCYYVIYVGTV